MTPELAAGWSALVGATATVVGAVALVLFFSRGQPWGTINDASSVVLMLAMIPVALLVAALEAEQFAPYAFVLAAIGIVAMLVAAWYQALLVAGRVTYEQTKGRVLAAGGFVGLWYILIGVIGLRALGDLLAGLAVASGVGFIAVGYGFAVGNERHPLSAIGGLVLLVASTAFLALLGTRLVGGDLVIPDWTA